MEIVFIDIYTPETTPKITHYGMTKLLITTTVLETSKKKEEEILKDPVPDRLKKDISQFAFILGPVSKIRSTRNIREIDDIVLSSVAIIYLPTTTLIRSHFELNVFGRRPV